MREPVVELALHGKQFVVVPAEVGPVSFTIRRRAVDLETARRQLSLERCVFGTGRPKSLCRVRVRSRVDARVSSGWVCVSVLRSALLSAPRRGRTRARAHSNHRG